MRLYFARLFLLIAILLPSALFCQPGSVVDSLSRKMYLYALDKSASTLYVHFDKNIYTNRETAWFTGYVLNNLEKRKANVLSVALLRNSDRSIFAEGKFVMNEDLSQGNLYIPDSLPTGDYSFICYTDAFVNDKPADIFVQPVTIKTVNVYSFNAKLIPVDSLKPGLDSMRVRLSAHLNDGTSLKGAEVKYYIGGAEPLKSGITKTDISGEAIISIPLKVLDASNNLFQAEIRNGKEVQTFSLQFPAYKKEAMVKFYPEGGNLVDGLKSIIGWEAVNNEGLPLQVTATLYEDDKQIGVITTNYYGTGQFSLTPSSKSIYRVKLQTIAYAKDTVYVLPSAILQGPVATINNALVNDTLDIIITNKQKGTRWTGLIHDFKNILFTVAVTANGNRVRVKVPLTGIPRGLYAFTLLDSIQRPWVERMFFANFSRKPELTISTNETFYNIRQKVTVRLKVIYPPGKPLPALVSIACVSNSRFDVKKMTDIESYSYLTHELSALPFKRSLMAIDNENKSFIENLLLVKGWRKYKWQDLAAADTKETAPTVTNIVYTGNVLLRNKPLKNPVKLTLLKKPQPIIIKTDKSGNFTIPLEQLILRPGHNLRLVVDALNQNEYIINVSDFYKEWNKKMAPALPLVSYAPFVSEQSSQTAVIDIKERVKELPGVLITAGKKRNFRGNACGDYVCVADVLNCPRHLVGGRDPIVGAVYNTGMGKKVYQGCEGMTYLSKIDGIFTQLEFYVPGYRSDGPPEEEVGSTVYWNHSLLTGNKGEVNFSFYTNDLTGKFRIVVQGITAKSGVVYGEYFFDVKEKQ